MRQLLLNLSPPPPPRLDNFVVGSNTELFSALCAWQRPENREFSFLLWGESSAGKTHLLKACADIYINAPEDPALESLTQVSTACIAIDTLEALNAAGEIALFNLFNRLREAKGKLLTAASAPPQALLLREDLRTRLGSGLIYRLTPLSDEEKIAALHAQGLACGLKLSDDILHYLLSRAPRDMRTLSALIRALDAYSLEHQRPITLPLLREVLRTPL